MKSMNIQLLRKFYKMNCEVVMHLESFSYLIYVHLGTIQLQYSLIMEAKVRDTILLTPHWSVGMDTLVHLLKWRKLCVSHINSAKKRLHSNISKMDQCGELCQSTLRPRTVFLDSFVHSLL